MCSYCVHLMGSIREFYLENGFNAFLDFGLTGMLQFKDNKGS